MVHLPDVLLTGAPLMRFKSESYSLHHFEITSLYTPKMYGDQGSNAVMEHYARKSCESFRSTKLFLMKRLDEILRSKDTFKASRVLEFTLFSMWRRLSTGLDIGHQHRAPTILWGWCWVFLHSPASKTTSSSSGMGGYRRGSNVLIWRSPPARIVAD